MNDQDYIRAGIELADGWEYDDDIHNKVWVRPDHYVYANNDDSQQIYLDALAAQLVRQVDALDNIDIDCHKERTYLREWSGLHRDEVEAIGSDRTMNAIKVVVDSEVLSQ